MDPLRSHGGTWQAVHQNAAFEAGEEHLAAGCIAAGHALLAGTQAQEAALAAQLMALHGPGPCKKLHVSFGDGSPTSTKGTPTPRAVHRQATPAHVNLPADGSPPGVQDLSRLQLLSARLRESLHSTQQRLNSGGGRGGSLPCSPAGGHSARARHRRSAPQSAAASPTPTSRHRLAPAGEAHGSGQMEDRVRALEAALAEEQQHSRRLQEELAGLQAASPLHQRHKPAQGEQCCEAAAQEGADARLQGVPPPGAVAPAAQGAQGSAFALRGFRHRLRRLEEENCALRRVLSPPG